MLNLINSNKMSFLLFKDLKQAFDTISHTRLAGKKDVGIMGRVILMFSFTPLSLQLEDNVYDLINLFRH